jgi:MoaA/NifB/PqqE/SkfB family radical SAM enzyme
MLQLLSIELTNRCSKACSFCYNHSGPEGTTEWRVEELLPFLQDCVRNGLKAVSFGGGEPLQYPGLFELLQQLDGLLFRSLTSNGLLLHGELFEKLIEAKPNKVHLSIHFPERTHEVERVIAQVHELDTNGIRSGVNFLVSRANLDAAKPAAKRVRESGIPNQRITYLPMRGRDTPTPEELAEVAGREPFQSMTCLTNCAKSPRFASLGWDKTVAWCSYTETRVVLNELSYAELVRALTPLGLAYCGGTDDVRTSTPEKRFALRLTESRS